MDDDSGVLDPVGHPVVTDQGSVALRRGFRHRIRPRVEPPNPLSFNLAEN